MHKLVAIEIYLKYLINTLKIVLISETISNWDSLFFQKFIVYLMLYHKVIKQSNLILLINSNLVN